MPLVRSISRDVIKNNGRFSSMVLGIVKSKPFQMNIKGEPAAAPTTTTASAKAAETKGVN
jgi:hypothetical protein